MSTAVSVATHFGHIAKWEQNSSAALTVWCWWLVWHKCSVQKMCAKAKAQPKREEGSRAML